MMRPATRLCMAVLLCLSFTFSMMAQPADEGFKKLPKPYKILTNGKQVTVKSTKNIKNIMVWTATGHRIVEQRDVNTPSYTFTVTGKSEKVYFLMLQYDNGKPYTEKIGIQ